MPISKINGLSSFGKIIQVGESSIGKVNNLTAEEALTRYTLYVDGVEQGTDTSQSEISAPIDMVNFAVGTTASPSTHDYFHFVVDNCFISNNIDSNLYSLRDYSENVPGRGDPIVFWWRCDGNTSYEAVWNEDFDYAISGCSPYVWGDAIVGIDQTSNGTLYKSASRSAHVHASDYNADGPSSVCVGGLVGMPSYEGRIAAWVRLPDIGSAHTNGGMFGLGTFEYVGEDFRQAMIAVMFAPGTYPDVTCQVAIADIVGGTPNYFVMPSISASLTYGTWYFVELAYKLKS